MVLLRKADIINGTKQPQEVEIKLLGKSILLRPLSDGEYSEYKALKNDIGEIEADVSMGDDGEIDTDKTYKNAKERFKELKNNSLKNLKIGVDMKQMENSQFQADCKAAAYGLSIQETFFVHDVEKMQPVGVVKEIADAVIRISKLSNEGELAEDVNDFRKE